MLELCFVFKENWVGIEIAGMKIVFFLFLIQPGPIYWPQMAQIWNSFNRILIFNPLERQKLHHQLYVSLRLTKVKF